MPYLLLFKLGAVLALLVAAYFTWEHFVADPYREEGAAKVHKELDPKVSAAETERDHAKADTEACVVKVQNQNDLVDLWQGKAKDNFNAAKAARAAADKDAAAKAPMIAQLQADAAAKPKLMKCEDELAQGKTILLEALKARRDPQHVLPGAK